MSPTNLPLFSNKDLGSIKSSINAGHAQNFSVFQLNTRKDINEAKVSVADVNDNKKAVTSISRVNDYISKPTGSISHVDTNVSPDQVTNFDQNEADDKRYEYIRRLAIERRKERELAGEKNIYDLGVRTGAGFRTKGLSSIKRRLDRLYTQAPSTFKNIDKEDRKYFAGVVGEHAKKVRVGVGFGNAIKKKMKFKIEKDKQKGIISKADSDDMKKMVDNLPHS